MKKLLFILLITIPFIGVGQGWEKTYNINTGSDGYSIQQTNDGGYILVGRTVNNEDDFVLIKTDSYGDTLWTKEFINIHDQICYSVKQTNDGGYIIGGFSEDTLGSSDILLIKTDSLGNTLWDGTYGGNDYDGGWFVTQTLDGGYILTGYDGNGSLPNGESLSDLILIKTDSLGGIIWSQTDSTGIRHEGKEVIQTNDSGYVVLGLISMNYGMSTSLIKTNYLGDTLWTKKFQGLYDYHVMNSVKQTIDGGYIMTGYTEIFTGMNYYNQTVLVKTNSFGDTLWTKNYGGSDNEGKFVQQTISDSGYVFCEKYMVSPNNYDIRIIKTKHNGDTLWTKTYGSIYDDFCWCIQQTNDGGYVISGTSYPIGMYPMVYIIKTDGNGNITSTFNIPTPSSDRKLKKVVDMLGREIKSQTNTPFIEIYDDGSTEKKLIIEK